MLLTTLNVNRSVLTYCLCLLFSCNRPQESARSLALQTSEQTGQKRIASTAQKAKIDTVRIDTKRIKKLTMPQALAAFGPAVSIDEYDFPKANAAGIREGLLNYIPITSKKQHRIKQLTWKRGENLTTVFYNFQTTAWRPLDVIQWHEGDVF